MKRDARISRWHPFRSPALSGPQVGWFRPAAAIIIAMILPALAAIAFIYSGAPIFSGPPKDGTGYTMADHLAIVLGALGLSFLTSWVAAPLVLLALRAAVMLGFAGWGSALIMAWVIGLPVVHVVLNGDVTTDEHAILPHMICAIGILGLSVWAAFWVLFAFRCKDKPA